MKNRPIRKVSFAKGLSFSTIQSFAEAFPHLTKEEIDYYYPAVSKTVATSPAKAPKEVSESDKK